MSSILSAVVLSVVVLNVSILSFVILSDVILRDVVLSVMAIIGQTKFILILFFVKISERPKSGVIYETCHGHDEPIIFTGHSKNLWVDFVANHNSSGKGFQISFLTIEGHFKISTFLEEIILFRCCNNAKLSCHLGKIRHSEQIQIECLEL
jgi:hypothetical protein